MGKKPVIQIFVRIDLYGKKSVKQIFMKNRSLWKEVGKPDLYGNKSIKQIFMKIIRHNMST